jgi:hypothetical protein
MKTFIYKTSIASSISFLLWLLISCQPTDKTQPKEPSQNKVSITLNDTIATDTVYDQSAAENVMMENTEKIESSVQAYDQLTFGMQKNEVNQLNKASQKIGNFSYNFKYLYNGAGQLYKITIKSEPEKTLYYESNLQRKYSNLCSVIAEKYGKKSSCGMLPSIFEVMNAKLYKMVEWQDEDKKIILSLRYTSLDSYYVECSIIHKMMEKEENIRLYRLKNKHIIEASKKF